ncbi:nuclear transport factor 2 family protein [Solitalea koreensis]|nr:nuclear transport factor 2 family protein [Solitalea koreensis]
MKSKFTSQCLIIGCLLGLISCQVSVKRTINNETFRNKAIAEKIFAAFDLGDPDALDNLIAKNAIDHSKPEEIKSNGLQASKELCKMQKFMYSKMKSTINKIIAEGDMVAVYFTSKATDNTGEEIKTDGVDIIKFKDGKAIEHWAFTIM